MAAVSSEEIEKIEGAEDKDRSWYENHISDALLDFYYGAGYEENDIIKSPMNLWQAALIHVNRQCVNREDISTVEKHIINNYGGYAQNLTYDPEKIGMLCDIYISLCFRYDKIVSAYGFSLMLGVSYDTLKNWRGQYNVGEVSSASRLNQTKTIMQNIKDARQNSLENFAFSGGKGTIGSLAALNYEYGWSGKGQYIEDRRERALAAEELPLYPVFSIEDKQGGAEVSGLPFLGSATGSDDSI